MRTSIDWKTVIVAAAVALIVGLATQSGRATAGSSTDNDGHIVAVTGEYGNGTSVLWVIDTKARQMALYRSMNGQSVELVGARRIRYDLELASYRDASESSYSPIELEKQFEKWRQGQIPNPPGHPVAPKNGPKPAKDG
ncbi:MAG: hypothetical protein KDB53_19040 [Planctomycetes bacterium]|nr:hypothetical protein [Planctomycetota bacterium]